VVVRIHQDYTEILAVKGQEYAFSTVVLASTEKLTAETLISEVGILLSRYENLFDVVNRIYVTGEFDDNLLEELRSKIEDVEILDQGIQLDSKTAKPRSEILTAVGLAVSASAKFSGSKLNLVPHEKRMVITRPNLIGTILLATLTVIMLVAVATQGYFQKKALLQQIDIQIEALQDQVDVVLNIRSRVEEKKGQLKELQEMLEGRQETLLILKDLTERIPDNTYLQNLQFQGDEITMQGYSDQISTLLPVLQDSPYLETVKTNWIQQDPRNRSKERFNLGATIKLNSNEEVSE
jgi:Tfp pilus assembly protein PilN